MGVLQNVCKPVGFWGRLMVRAMNGGSHARLAEWGFSFLPPIAPESLVLDAGCGGGANVGRWLRKCPRGQVVGLDYSPISVQESIRTNQTAIQNGSCRIVQGDVAGLPFEDRSFDCVSAFETVYFWPSLQASFQEIHRVLRPGGLFFICNESNGRDPVSVKLSHAKLIKGMRLYDRQALQAALQAAGFSNLQFHERTAPPWLCLLAEKPE